MKSSAPAHDALVADLAGLEAVFDPALAAEVDAALTDRFDHEPSLPLDPSQPWGDERGLFAAFYVRHRHAIACQARRYLNDARDVDEVVQETFLRLFLALPDLDSELQALAWSRRTATNLCIDRYRATRRRPSLVDIDAVPEDLVADDAAVEDPLLRAEDAAVVREALALLSPLHRAALIKREIEEKPLPQIAAELGVPEESVKHLLHRARRALRRLLADSAVDPRHAVGTALAILLVVLLGIPLLGGDEASHRTDAGAPGTVGRLDGQPGLPGTGQTPDVGTDAPTAPGAPTVTGPASGGSNRGSSDGTGRGQLLSGSLGAPNRGALVDDAGASGLLLGGEATDRTPQDAPSDLGGSTADVTPRTARTGSRFTGYKLAGVYSSESARVDEESKRTLSSGAVVLSSDFEAPTAEGTFVLHHDLSFAPDGALADAALSAVAPSAAGDVGYIQDSPAASAERLDDGTVAVTIGAELRPLVGELPAGAPAVDRVSVQLLYAPDLLTVLSEQVLVTAEPIADVPSSPAVLPAASAEPAATAVPTPVASASAAATLTEAPTTPAAPAAPAASGPPTAGAAPVQVAAPVAPADLLVVDPALTPLAPPSSPTS